MTELPSIGPGPARAGTCHTYVYVAPGIANPNGYDLYTLGKDGQVGGTGENADITSWNGPVVQ